MNASDLARFGLSPEACVFCCVLRSLLSAQDGVQLEEYFAGGRLTMFLQGKPIPEVDRGAILRLLKASRKVRSVVLEDTLFRHCFEKTGALSCLSLLVGSSDRQLFEELDGVSRPSREDGASRW